MALTAIPIAYHPKILHRATLVCRNRRQNLLFLTQPSRYEEVMPPELERLLVGSYREGVYVSSLLLRLLERYNDGMRNACDKAGVPCLDLARLRSKSTSVFDDDGHFNIEGCERVA